MTLHEGEEIEAKTTSSKHIWYWPFWILSFKGSFGFYLLSFFDFHLKIHEGEEIEAKTTSSKHIWNWPFWILSFMGSFGLYLLSFFDFHHKIHEREEIEAKTTSSKHIWNRPLWILSFKGSFSFYLLSFLAKCCWWHYSQSELGYCSCVGLVYNVTHTQTASRLPLSELVSTWDQT